MVLTREENNRLRELLKPYLGEEHVRQMKKYRQHGSVSTYEHCENVARVSYWISRKFFPDADEDVLVTGAFLHDFYLYDWHVREDWHRLHGFSHADTACRNAVKYFQIGPREQSVIWCHMWPLNFFRIPRSQESLIVCMADKYCSLIEILVCGKRGVRTCG